MYKTQIQKQKITSNKSSKTILKLDNITLINAQKAKQNNIQKQQQIESVDVSKQPQAQSFIQSLAFMLIRPPRLSYNSNLLHPRYNFRFLMQTHFVPGVSPFQLTLYTQLKMKYVVLYLHGNASSRLQACLMLQMIPTNVGFACFDFYACGNRQQDGFITLGKNQSKQVNQAAKYLKSLGYQVAGWGRSMGAASLLLSSQIQIMIADSSYSSLTQLCEQSQKKVVPCILQCFSSCLFSYIFGKQTQLNIQTMQIAEIISSQSNTHRQICFLHGQQDTLIDVKHCERLYQAFGGRKKLCLFEGTHNSNRLKQVIDLCFNFIQQSFDLLQIKELQDKRKILSFKGSNQKLSSHKIQQINSLKKKIRMPSSAQKQKKQLKLDNYPWIQTELLNEKLNKASSNYQKGDTQIMEKDGSANL